MKEEFIPQTIDIGQQTYTFGQIHTVFSATEDGVRLKANTRYKAEYHQSMWTMLPGNGY